MAKSFRDNGKVLAGICAAASGLAATGVLNDVAHTGNSLASHQRYPGYQGSHLYRDQPQAVRDRGIVTAAGSSPNTFTVEVLKALDLWTPEAEMELSGFGAEHAMPR